MYENWFGFQEKPFSLTPDPKYLYLSQRHSEAFAHLEFGRRERGGFILLTGEVGTGKTTLARYFLSWLPADTASAFVLYPALTAGELLRAILDDFHATPEGGSLKELVDALHRFLLQARRDGRQVVLLIDEAQDLAPEVLEQIRLISNLETDTEKLIQIVLLGQSELRALLDRHELRQLAQRITARYHLEPLTRGESEEYVRHRVTVAGGAGKVNFTPGALAAVHRLSSGVPRLINLICDRALLGAFVRGERTLHAWLVQRAADEVRGRTHRRRRWVLAAAAGLAALVALAVAPPAARSLRPPPPSSPPAEPAASPPAAPREDALLARRFEAALLAEGRDASFGEAATRVRALWGAAALERTTLRTHLDQLRQLDLPVVLEVFHPARRDTCFLALLGLSGDEARVALGPEELRLPAAWLDRHWTREAVFFWPGAGTLEGEAWASGSLARLGYEGADFAAAVSRFQRDMNLVPDGVAGSRTLMTLFSLAPGTRPRLDDGKDAS